MQKMSTLTGAVLSLACGASQAVNVYGDFFNTAGSHWTAQFSVTNTGSLPEVNNFTIYFDQAYASNLRLLASPTAWDTIVIQPDSALASPGFMDALVIDSASALRAGQSASGFGVSFDWDLVREIPTSFDVVVSDSNFQPIWAGRTVSVVPEPAAWLLIILGLISATAYRIRS